MHIDTEAEPRYLFCITAEYMCDNLYIVCSLSGLYYRYSLTDYTWNVDDVITRNREINLCKNSVLAISLCTAS